MKKVLQIVSGLILVSSFGSCIAEQEIQGEMVNAELVKIDTVYRYPSQQQLLTWRSAQRNVEYVTYASINSRYTLGSRITMIVSR